MGLRRWRFSNLLASLHAVFGLVQLPHRDLEAFSTRQSRNQTLRETIRNLRSNFLFSAQACEGQSRAEGDGIGRPRRDVGGARRNLPWVTFVPVFGLRRKNNSMQPGRSAKQTPSTIVRMLSESVALTHCSESRS